MTEIGHFIGNAHVAGGSGRRQPVYNPATGAAEKTVALASAAEVDGAVAAAVAAWPAWAETPPLRRARILDRFKTLLWERADTLAYVDPDAALALSVVLLGVAFTLPDWLGTLLIVSSVVLISMDSRRRVQTSA